MYIYVTCKGNVHWNCIEASWKGTILNRLWHNFIIALIKYVHTWLMIIKAGKREGTGCFAASCTMGGSVNMSCTHIDQGPQCLPVELWKPSKKRSIQNRRSSLLAEKPYQSDMNMRKTKAMHATHCYMHHIVIFPCLSHTQSRIAAPAPGTMYKRAARFIFVNRSSWELKTLKPDMIYY